VGRLYSVVRVSWDSHLTLLLKYIILNALKTNLINYSKLMQW